MSYTHAQYQFNVTKSYLVEAYNQTFMSQPAEALNQGPLATMLEKSRIGIEGFVEQYPSPLAFANTSLDTSLNNAYFYSTKTNSTHSIHPISHTQCMRNVIILVTQQDIKPNEEIIEDKGVKVLIDPKAIMYLLGTEMDYKKEKFSSQFVFKNPNETERCGCGESFKI